MHSTCTQIPHNRFFLIITVLLAPFLLISCGGGGGGGGDGDGGSDTTAPVNTLIGPNPQMLEVGSTYNELGATASDNVDGDISANVIIDASLVDTTTVGSYSVAYSVTDAAGNAAAPVTRTVNVVDSTAPVITLKGANPQTLEGGSIYSELGATASDNVDGDISANVIIDASLVDTTTVGSYSVAYSVTDAAGNAATPVTRTVNVVDTTAPVITLTGANPQTLEVGGTYSELGATAVDNLDGDITMDINIAISTVNTAMVGSYSAEYSVTDSSGNGIVLFRTVQVVDTTAPIAALLPLSIPFGSSLPIVITFSESMNITSLSLAGSLMLQNKQLSWSTDRFLNDTLTITPNNNWVVDSGASLIVNAADQSGNSLVSDLNPYGIVYFVNSSASDDAGDGLTIISAKKTVSAAIIEADMPATVIVNAGSYTVNSDSMGVQTHVVLKEGVSLSGGYNSDFTIRDTSLFPSIISDISSEFKGGTGDIPPSSAIESVSGITSKTIVDGFTVSGSVESGVNYTSAILISDGAPTIQNNILNGGDGSVTSRAVDIRGASIPVIQENLISGGGSSSSYGVVTATSSIIKSNVIGAAFGIWAGGNSSPQIYNNTIHAPSFGIINNNASSVISNNTLYSISTGTGVYNQNGSSATIENNIIWYPTCLVEFGANTEPATIKNNNLNGCVVVYIDDDASCTGNADGDGDNSTCTLTEMEALTDFSVGSVSGNIAVDPLFVDIDGADNDIATTNDNDWHLQLSSPVNVREGGLDLSSLYTTDQDNLVRTAIIKGAPSNAGASGWSMGAFEYDEPNFYYVNIASGNDSNDGLTILSAKQSIMAAIIEASPPAVVKISAGDYLVNSDSMGVQTHVVLKEGVSLSGGYNSDFTIRDTSLFPSIISDISSEFKGGTGDIPPSSAIESVSGITSKTIVDGFTVSGSVESGVNYTSAILISDGAPTIQNNILNGGDGSVTSRAVDIRGASIPVIQENLISGGGSSSSYGVVTATSSIIKSNVIGAAFGIWAGGNSSPQIYNNTIHAPSFGIINNNASSVISNNTLYSISTGTGVYNQNGSSATIENNIIWYPTCLVEFGANTEPATIKNNNLNGCVVVYIDDDASCTGNADGDGDNSTCTLTEMEALTDFSVGSVSGNIAVDPLFVDIDGADNDIATTNDNDWHLQLSSPVNVREGGLDLSSLYTTDQDNLVRTAIIKGAPSNAGASGWSMGAFEQD